MAVAGPWPEPVLALQARPSRADVHEAMEKLATADDIAAAVRAAGRRATTA